MRKWMLLVSTMALAACTANSPPPADAGTAAPAPADPAMHSPASVDPPGDAVPDQVDGSAFVDRVWRAIDGSAVEAGTTYVFLGDGTLLIDAPSATPITGRWDYRDRQLTMTEEGIAYPVDIVRLDDNRFTIRSNNPGGAVTIALQAAPELPLPQLQ